MINEHTTEQESSRTAPRSRTENSPEPRRGLGFERFFTASGVHPFDELTWERRDATIKGPDGKLIFEQKNVEAPSNWSQTAVNIVAQKYFRGLMDTPGREQSIKDLIRRVVTTITGWGIKQKYFKSSQDAEVFSLELTHLLVNQKASFNSPVWFNVGVDEHPQCSACFINSVEDTMDGILRLAHTEGMLFKWGSGTGTNFSTLRSSREHLNGGGTASGPVSFMRGFDAFAGVIKSGGKTRRAAKMVILNVDHPDILEFIECKAKEERKAWALIDAGYDGSFGGEAYASVFFQNSNNSVRVTDEFMQAVIHDRPWQKTEA
jgi:ribonucleoside-diphosphate reductase alpha chain